MTKNNYTDLEAYMNMMLSELNELQESAKRFLSENSPESRFEWMKDNGELLQKYCTLTITNILDFGNDTDYAQRETCNEYLKTMAIIYQL